LVAPAIVAPVFRQQLLGNKGWINTALRAVGFDSLAFNWIADSRTAMLSVMLITVWHSTGMAFILYFAALSQIDTEVLEAARIDGAGNIRVFASIVLPSAKGTVVALAMLGAIGALKVFDIPYLVTAAGPNHATEFLGTFIFRMTVRQAHVGYGAALTIALLLVAVVMALILNSARDKD
jgi:raffinose/stachyose/melibiose transport system permease protein